MKNIFRKMTKKAAQAQYIPCMAKFQTVYD